MVFLCNAFERSESLDVGDAHVAGVAAEELREEFLSPAEVGARMVQWGVASRVLREVWMGGYFDEAFFFFLKKINIGCISADYKLLLLWEGEVI